MYFNRNPPPCQYQIFAKTSSNGTFSPQISLKIFQIRIFPSNRSFFRPVFRFKQRQTAHDFSNRNGIKKPDLFGSVFLWRRSRDMFNSEMKKTCFRECSVSLAVTGFGNIVAPCIARKSLHTTSKNPTYSDRVICGGEAGI